MDHPGTALVPVIEKLEQLLAYRAPEHKEMWTVDDIATYSGLGLRSVRDRMVHLPDFPVAIAPLGGQHKIWKASEVKGWLNRRRER